MKKYAYTSQVVFSSINLENSSVGVFRKLVADRLTSLIKDLSIDLIDSIVIKESDIPIINDRVVLNVIMMFSECMDLRQNFLKNKIQEVITSVSEDMGLVTKFKSLTISKL